LFAFNKFVLITRMWWVRSPHGPQGKTWLAKARQCVAREGKAWLGKARHGYARQVKARQGKARRV
jgi:hypothetical protein